MGTKEGDVGNMVGVTVGDDGIAEGVTVGEVGFTLGITLGTAVGAFCISTEAPPEQVFEPKHP